MIHDNDPVRPHRPTTAVPSVESAFPAWIPRTVSVPLQRDNP